MNRLILLALFLLGCSPAWADCQSAGNLTIGGSVICKQAVSKTGTTTNISGDSIAFSPTTGNQLVLWGYMCTTNNCVVSSDWAANHTYPTFAGSGQETTGKILPTVGNPCNFTFASTTGGTSGGTEPVTWSTTPCGLSSPTVTDNTVTWKAVTLVVGFNGPSTACVAASPTSPAFLQLDKTYLNWSLYCPSAPASITQVGMNCSVTLGCSFISMFYQEYTGMCGTAPCYDTDGNASAASVQSQSVSTSPGTIYTNELITYLAGTKLDEALTAGGGCVQVDQQASITGNQVGAKYATATGTQSCSTTWTGADTSGMLIIGIKSAASALGQSPICKIWKMEKLDP